MKTSEAGRDLIKQFEGVRLNAYLDSGNIPTIGVGHIQGVKMGDVITMEEADELLSQDLHSAETAVNNGVKVDITQNQFDAMTSLAFNIGNSAFTNSTLLRKLNAHDTATAADQFLVWNRAGGKVIQGLSNRRAAERKWFLS